MTTTPKKPNVHLVRPGAKHLASYLSFLGEMRANGDVVWDSLLPQSHESPVDFVERWLRAETHPTPPLVPESMYWAVESAADSKSDIVVGRISLRHELNANLQEYGGHIGYEVRPSKRRQGMAKEMLALLLKEPKTKAIGKLLITCAPTNEASIRTIIGNGGKFLKTAYVERVKRDTNYYEIDL